MIIFVLQVGGVVGVSEETITEYLSDTQIRTIEKFQNNKLMLSNEPKSSSANLLDNFLEQYLDYISTKDCNYNVFEGNLL